MNSLRAALLRELRLGPLWRLRAVDTDRLAGDSAGGASRADANQSESDASPSTPPTRTATEPRRTPRPQPMPVATNLPAAPQQSADTARLARIGSLAWDELETEIRDCRACRLCERRRQTVPGVGDRDASWMFVGEGPGSEEDRRGEPFVGPAGKLLDAMLAALGLERGRGVYIANAVKCRPPMNRTPHSDETESCRPFLERQIALVRPKVLVALGRPAAQTLLETEVRINAVRGKIFAHDGIPVVVTYHPAYLLRNPSDKRKAWEDLCLARRIVTEAGGH